MTRQEALFYRAYIESAVQSLEDTLCPVLWRLYPRWGRDNPYEVGFKVQYEGRVYRCRQAHTPQKGWEPDKTPALWEEVVEDHLGTYTDPIPYHGGLTLTEGQCYIQDGIRYLCIRSTGQPVYHSLHDLLGLYVKEIQEEARP